MLPMLVQIYIFFFFFDQIKSLLFFLFFLYGNVHLYFFDFQPFIYCFKNKASLLIKEALFTLQRSLVCVVKKPCFETVQDVLVFSCGSRCFLT